MDENSLTNVEISEHAEARCQQRGVRIWMLNMLIKYADKKINIENGCLSLSISKSKIDSLKEMGILEAQYVEKITKLTIVLDAEKRTIITVLHPEDDKRGRHYRKSVKRRHQAQKRRVRSK